MASQCLFVRLGVMSKLLTDIINARYNLKSKFSKRRLVSDNSNRLLIENIQPVVRLIEQAIDKLSLVDRVRPIISETKPSSVREVATDTGIESISAGVQTEGVDIDEYRPYAEDTFEYSPEKSVQERFAEHSFQERSEILEQLPELARPFIDMLLSDDVNLDNVYGVKLNSENLLQIGNATVDIDPIGADLIFSKEYLSDSGEVKKAVVGEFEGTPGLYSLLFTKNPSFYTEEDKDNYKKILFLSDAIKFGYAGSRKYSHKFKTIISSFLSNPIQ